MPDVVYYFDMNTISVRQKEFARHIVAGKSATQAAKDSGYSHKQARTTGPALLRNDLVKDEIQNLMKGQLNRLEVKAEDIFRELLATLTCDPATAFDDDGKLKSIQDMPESTRRAIKSIKLSDSGITSIGFWPKDRMIELAMKHLGLLQPDTQININVGLADRLKSARARVVDGTAESVPGTKADNATDADG